MQQELGDLFFRYLKSVRKMFSRQFPLRKILRRWEKGKVGKWEEMQFLKNKNSSFQWKNCCASAEWLENCYRQSQLFNAKTPFCSHSTPRAVFICFHFFKARIFRSQKAQNFGVKIENSQSKFFCADLKRTEILHA